MILFVVRYVTSRHCVEYDLYSVYYSVIIPYNFNIDMGNARENDYMITKNSCYSVYTWELILLATESICVL